MRVLKALWCVELLFGLLLLVLVAPCLEASWLDPALSVKKMYADLLGRQPKPEELNALTSAVIERKQNLMDVMRGLYQNKEFAEKWIDADFVDAAYLSNLGRPPDPIGQEHYLRKLQEGSMTPQAVVDEMANSPEGKAFALRQLYFEILYREIDEPGKEFYLKNLEGKTLKGYLPVQVEVPAVKPPQPAGSPAPVKQGGQTPPISDTVKSRQQAQEQTIAAAQQKEKAAAQTPAKKKVWVIKLNECGKQVPDVAKALMDSFERKRFTEHYLQAKNLIAEFYKNILNRNADEGGLRNYLHHWSTEWNLMQIYNHILDSDEFKKRKLDEIETAYLRYLLRPADAGGLDNYRNQQKKGRSIRDIVHEIKCSDEGMRAAVRRLYWEILNREIDSGGQNVYTPRLRVDSGKKPSVYKDIAIDILMSDEAKTLRSMTQTWREVRNAQQELLQFDADNLLQLITDTKKEFEARKADAEKVIKELEAKLPAEFASMAYVIESALAGVDLQKMNAALEKLAKEVQGLGPLLTGQVQKVFVELLGQPAPDFYAGYNAAQPSWEGAPAAAGSVGGSQPPAVPGGKQLPPGKLPPSVAPVADLPAVKPIPIPGLPGFDPKNLPQDLLAKAQKLMAGIKPGPDAAEQLKAGLIQLIVQSPLYKQLEPQRQELVVSLFQNVLKRPPTEEEVKTWLKKLESGQVTLAVIRAELEKLPEFALVKDMLEKGKIPPFQPGAKSKNGEQSKAADEALKEKKSVCLADLEGFKLFDFAKEVVITDCVKTEDDDGFCITGSAKLDRYGLGTPVKAFAKVHPSIQGDHAYIVGFFFTNPWKATSFYSKIPDKLKSFLPTMQLDKGGLLFTSEDTVLQVESVPENIRKDVAELLGNTGHQGIRLSPGLNVAGRLNLGLGDGFKHLNKLLGGGQVDIVAQAYFPQNPEDLFVRALLPAFGKGIFPNEMTPAESTLEINGRPALSVETSLGFKLPKDQPVTGRLRFEIPLGPQGSMSMVAAIDGVWKNAFGRRNLDIGNLVLTGKIEVPSMAPAFGLAGDFRFGKKVVRIAASIPVTINLASMGLRGSINALGTEDILALMKELGMNVKSLPFPADLMGLQDVAVSVAGAEDKNLEIPQGIYGRATLCIKSDKVAAAEMAVNDGGVEVQGEAKSLNLGPLSFSPGVGPDGVKGTKDDAKIVDVSIPADGSVGHAFFSGKASLFGVGRDLTVWIDRRGMGFSDAFQLFNAFTSKVEVQGNVSPSNPEFQAKVEIKADLAGKLESEVDNLTGGHTPGFVKKIFRNIFNLRRAGFEGVLSRDLLEGAIPKFWIEFGVMGEAFNFTLDVNLKDQVGAVKRLAGKAKDYVVDKVKKFVSEYLKALADFFGRLFGGRGDKLKALLDRYKNASNNGPQENNRARAQWDGVGNGFGAYYDK